MGEGVAREDSDVVGDVLVKRGDGEAFAVVRFGGDGTGQSLERYCFAFNTVLVAPGAGAAVFRLFSGLESVEMHSNIFAMRGGGTVNLLREVEAERTSGRAVAGTNNWVPTGADLILSKMGHRRAEPLEKHGAEPEPLVVETEGGCAVEEVVIRVPVEFKRLATAFEEIVAAVSAFEDRAPRGRSVDYGLHEQLVAELVGRVERETHRASLLALDLDADRVRIDDRLYQRVLFEGTHFHCRAGSVDVTRGLFREVGVRNGPTVDLVALRAGCVLGSWLPWTAAAMARRVAQGPSRDAAATSD